MTPIKASIKVLFVTFLLACSGVTPGPEATSPQTHAETHRPLLNSERIRQEFGSYGIEVVEQDDRLRVSNLYSLDSGVQTMRTLAVVIFPAAIPLPLQKVHGEITGGHSIGETLRESGWKVEKLNLYFGELAPEAGFDGVYAAMGDIAAAALAVHIYQLFVSRDGSRYLYATIAEVHHPNYQGLADLQSNYVAGMMVQGSTSNDVGIVLDDVIEVMQQY